MLWQIVGISRTPLSALLHVEGSTVFNGTTGVGGSEQIDVPVNQPETGLFHDYN